MAYKSSLRPLAQSLRSSFASSPAKSAFLSPLTYGNIPRISAIRSRRCSSEKLAKLLVAKLWGGCGVAPTWVDGGAGGNEGGGGGRGGDAAPGSSYCDVPSARL